jgi:hypothetical protein
MNLISQMDKFVSKLSKLISGDLLGSVSVSLGKRGNVRTLFVEVWKVHRFFVLFLLYLAFATSYSSMSVFP